MIKVLYTAFLGLLLALFVGVGTAVLYPSPQMPEDPLTYRYPIREEGLNTEEKEAAKEFDDAMTVYQKEMKAYSRTAALIVLGAALLLLIFGVVFAQRLHILANGLVLGGVFSLLYSIVLGFVADNTPTSFAIITVSLVAAIFVGHKRFKSDA